MIVRPDSPLNPPRTNVLPPAPTKRSICATALAAVSWAANGAVAIVPPSQGEPDPVVAADVDGYQVARTKQERKVRIEKCVHLLRQIRGRPYPGRNQR